MYDQALLLRVDRPQKPQPDGPPSAAALLNVSNKTVWRLVDLGELARVDVGSRTLVTRQSVDDYIARGGVRSLKKPDES